MAEELNELQAAIQHELELARSGDGYEEAAVASEIVERIVAPMLTRIEASRQAWAEEAMFSPRRRELRPSPAEVRPCSCLADGVELPAGWSRPQCAVHPETRGEGEERSGRDDTGQASREETPGNVSSRRLTTSGVPGPGDGTATPAPPSSRLPSVHPDGPELATPDEWCRRHDVTVFGPDGWRRDSKPWADPITEVEFWDRIAWSSVSMPVRPEGGPA